MDDIQEKTLDRPALYVGTYAKYNNGSIAGKWLYLDDYEDADAFYAACKELHKDESDPELMYQDFENFPKEFYSESGIDMEKLYIWVNLDDDDRELVNEFVDATGYRLLDVPELKDLRDMYFCTLEGSKYEWNREVGEYVADNGLLGVEIPESLASYIDYEAIGREWLFDYSVSSNGWVFSNI